MAIIIPPRRPKRYFDSLWHFVMNTPSEAITFDLFPFTRRQASRPFHMISPPPRSCIAVEALGLRADAILRFIRGGLRILVDDFYKGPFQEDL